MLGQLYFDLLKAEKNFSVSLIIDGESAYNKIVSENWDLILLDTLLPKINALELLNKLKSKNPNKLKQKFVIITNLDDNQLIASLKEYKFDILIKSHLNPAQFKQKVNQYVYS